MDLTKTGQIYNLQCFKPQTQQQSCTGSSFQQERSSFMERNLTASSEDDLDSRSRFEKVFLASPRAQVMLKTMVKVEFIIWSYASHNLSNVKTDLRRPFIQEMRLYICVVTCGLDFLYESNIITHNFCIFQQLYSSVGPSSQKTATVKTVPSFDEVVKMAELFHNKSSHNSSVSSVLSDQPLTLGKPKPFEGFLKDKEFGVSPFKPSMNDSTIKKKVSMVISRLEDDDSAITDKSSNRTKLNAEVRASRDSGFNDMPSDSGGSSEGAFTNVIVREAGVISARAQRNPARIDDSAQSTAGVVDNSEEVHISFESDNDEEIDIETDMDHVQGDCDENGDNNYNDEKNASDGEGKNTHPDKNCDNVADSNNNLTTNKSPERSVTQSLNSSTELGEGQVSNG